jgi:aryl-alcohol dehydrogenase-like predicted oxidoreductase
MRIRTLGRTGLRVSEICLGAMTFGMPEWGCDERESLALIDRFLEAGGNFIDTADAYSGTISEEICGQALAGRRTQIVLATKVTMPVGSGPNDRGASRKRSRSPTATAGRASPRSSRSTTSWCARSSASTSPWRARRGWGSSPGARARRAC